MTDVSGNAKKGDMSAFDDAIKKVADAVIKLTEAASQVKSSCSYLSHFILF